MMLDAKNKVLIEAYWNVNSLYNYITTLQTVVLIEAYWNVNSFQNQNQNYSNQVLIEAYWNVNLIFTGVSIKQWTQ